MDLFEHKGMKISDSDFTKILHDLGIKNNDVLFVHSSVWFGKPLIKEKNVLLDSLINIIKNSVPEGTVIMPAFSYSFCWNKVYDINKTPSYELWLGSLPERFRNTKGVKRSSHPIFSVSVLGKDKEKYIKVGKDSFGENSIFGLLHKNKAKILFFGSLFEYSLTFSHHIEQMHGVPYRFKKKFRGVINDGEKTYEEEVTFFVKYLDKNIELDFKRYEEILKKTGILKEKNIGRAKIGLIDVSGMYDEGFKLLDDNVYAFLKKEPENMLRLEVKNMPFYPGITGDQLTHFPTSMSFKLIFNFDSGLITQEPSKFTDNWTEKAYRHGSSLTFEEDSFNNKKSEDIINVIKKKFIIKDKSILEIGCKNGYLLHLLKKEGASKCLGIEPNPVFKKNKWGVEIINDFFDHSKIGEKFDLVFTHGVLEHIRDPVIFLDSIKKVLKKDGVMFHAVLNFEKGLSTGDLTLLDYRYHNYFTKRSVKNIYNKIGFGDVSFEDPGYDQMIYSSCKNKEGEDVDQSDFKLLENYIKKRNEKIKRIQKVINSYERIGVYGTFPQASLFKWPQKPVFYDDDLNKQGKFIPGFDNAINNPETIKDGELDAIFVVSIIQDSKIRDYLNNKVKKTKIISFKDLYKEVKKVVYQS